MHDPEAVAHEIKLPFFGRVINEKTRYKQYPVIAVIWHVDPERHGDEDSCGWFNRKDDKASAIIAEARKDGIREWTFIFGERGDRTQTPTEVIYVAWQMIAWRQFKRWNLSTKEINEVMRLSSWPTDNLRNTIYRAMDDPEQMGWVYVYVANAYLRLHRPWWDHPRWHVWHWRIQIPFLQDLKRFLFSRCAGCGKRFAWGYAPISNRWNGDGPRWFKGERGVFHHECIGHATPSAKEV
jgi:hypothetical protein